MADILATFSFAWLVLCLVGFLDVHLDFPADKLEQAVKTKGLTMVFDAAREIIRAATGRGLYGPLLIPSTTFFKSPVKE